MKKLILLIFLIMASVSFAVIEHDETEATDKVNEAKDALNGAETAINGNLSIFEPHFDKCPEVKARWDEANEFLTTAAERYDQAFDALELYQSDDAYDSAQDSLSASENVINTLDGLPNIVSICNLDNTTIENETESNETEPVTIEEPEETPKEPEVEQPTAETPPVTEPEPAPTACALSTIIILLSLVGLFLGRD